MKSMRSGWLKAVRAVMALFAIAGGQHLRAVDELVTMSVLPGSEVAFERGETKGRILVTRTGIASTTVHFAIAYDSAGGLGVDFILAAVRNDDQTPLTLDTTDQNDCFFTFPAGCAAAIIELTPDDDGITESPERLTAALRFTTNGDVPYGYTAGPTTSGVLTIKDSGLQASLMAPRPKIREQLALGALDISVLRLQFNASTSFDAQFLLEAGAGITDADYQCVLMAVPAPGTYGALTPITYDDYRSRPTTVAVMNHHTKGWEVRDNAPALASTITVMIGADGAFGQFLPGDNLFIGDSNAGYRISDVDGATIYLAGALAADVAKGTKVNNCYRTNPDDLMRLQWSSGTRQGVEIGFEPQDDASPEGAETIAVSTIFSDDYEIAAPGYQVVTLKDDDILVGFGASTDVTRPNNGVFKIHLNRPAPKDFMVEIETQAGTAEDDGDIVPIPGAILVRAGEQDISVPVIPTDGGNVGGYITKRIKPTDDYLPISGTGLSYNVSATVNVLPSKGKIWVEAIPAVSQPINAATVQESAGTVPMFRFHIERSDPLDTSSISVIYSFSPSMQASEGGDFQTVNSKVVTIGASNEVDLPLAIKVDSLFEGNETVTVQVEAGSGYELYPGAQVPAHATTATVVILDRAPLVSISPAAVTMAEGTPTTLTVSYLLNDGTVLSETQRIYLDLSPALVAGVDNGIYTIEGAGYDATVGIQKWFVDIAANEQAKPIILRANYNAGIQANRTVTVTVVNDPRTVKQYGPIGTTASTITITDNEPHVSIASTGDATEPWTPGGFLVSLSLASPSSTPIVVPFALSGTAVAGTDYVALGYSSVTFNSGDTTFPITITPISRAGFNGPRTLTLTLTGTNVTVATASATVTIRDEAAVMGVSNVSSTNANGTYFLGEAVAIQVTFSGPVTVTGMPRLALAVGPTAYASYISGSGSSTLVFNYVVYAGEQAADLDYTSTTALELNGGTIAPVAGGSTLDLTLPAPGAVGSLAANKSLIIDGVTLGDGKPTPGVLPVDESGGGGCGLGSGFAALLGSLLLAMRLALRVRRQD